VAKCINPRPKDRYSTVDGLIADVQRYLAGRPILARPQTTTYRLGKFVRRNRTLVGTVSVMLCCLLVVGGYAVWKREQAYREGQRALQMQTFMSELFKISNTYYTGKPAATVPELLRLGVKLIPDLIENPVDRRAAQLNLAESMFNNNDFTDARAVFANVIEAAKQVGDTPRLAEAESYAGKIANQLGDPSEAAALSANALLLSRDPGVTPAARVRITMYFVQNQVDRGIRTSQDEKLMRSAVAESQSRRLPAREQAWALGSLAYYLSATDALGEAKTLANRALAIYADEPFALCDRAEMHGLLANIQSQSGDSAGSAPLYRQAYVESRSCSGDASEETLDDQVMMSRAMIKSGHPAEAIPVLEAVLPVWRKTYPSDVDMAAPLSFLTRAYLQTSQFQKAEATATQALQIQTGKISPNSTRMAVCEFFLAQALNGQGRFAEALQHAERADLEYSTVPSLSAAEKVFATQAHQLRLDLKKKS
jgi:tetratricopeptide (TPR) repeat protein